MLVGSKRIGIANLPQYQRSEQFSNPGGTRAVVSLIFGAHSAAPSIILFCEFFHQKSPCPRAPASRLLPPQLRNPASCPSTVAQDRHETPFAADRATRAAAQNISVMLPL